LKYKPARKPYCATPTNNPGLKAGGKRPPFFGIGHRLPTFLTESNPYSYAKYPTFLVALFSFDFEHPTLKGLNMNSLHPTLNRATLKGLNMNNLCQKGEHVALSASFGFWQQLEIIIEPKIFVSIFITYWAAFSPVFAQNLVTNPGVGKKSAETAFLIVDHSDLANMREYLPKLEERCKEKEAEWEWYANMYDRSRQYDGKPQRYGTQYNKDPKNANHLQIDNLEDAAKVDEFRKSLGMSPIETYELWMKKK